MEAYCGHLRTSFIMTSAAQRLKYEKDLNFLYHIIKHIVCQAKSNTICCSKNEDSLERIIAVICGQMMRLNPIVREKDTTGNDHWT